MSADTGARERREQYERSFRRNRDDAIENGYDLCCPICGCAYNDDADEWSLNHDAPLHRLYDALAAGVGEARPAEPQWGKPYTDALQAECGRLRERVEELRQEKQKALDEAERWREKAGDLVSALRKEQQLAGRLQEQLDAAREALAATRLDAEKTYAWRERFEERAIRAEAELRMVEARAASVAETMKGQLP